jgi:hypothetical protein
MSANSTLTDLLLILSALTNDTTLAEPPMIVIVPAHAMPCQCEASYEDRKMYLRNDVNWTDPRWLSIVLHELEHHRQFLKRGTAHDCSEWMERERQALLLQTEYLERSLSGYRPAMTVACRWQ